MLQPNLTQLQVGVNWNLVVGIKMTPPPPTGNFSPTSSQPRAMKLGIQSQLNLFISKVHSQQFCGKLIFFCRSMFSTFFICALHQPEVGLGWAVTIWWLIWQSKFKISFNLPTLMRRFSCTCVLSCVALGCLEVGEKFLSGGVVGDYTPITSTHSIMFSHN